MNSVCKSSPPQVEVRHKLRHAHLAEQAARSANRPTRRPAPCTQMLPCASHFMPSGTPGSSSERMPLAKMRPVDERAVGVHLEHPDHAGDGVVDVEQLLVGREAQAVRLLEPAAVDEKLRRAAAGRHAVDALEAELARTLDAVDRHAAVPGVGEIDRAVGAHADIVRRIELLPVEMRREHLAPPVRPLAHQARCRVLADDQVQVGVIGHAVVLVRRPPHLAHAAARVPAPPHVGRHVGEQEIMIDRMPDRPFGEGEAGAELADRRIDVDQLLELGAHRAVGHDLSLNVGAAFRGRDSSDCALVTLIRRDSHKVRVAVTGGSPMRPGSGEDRGRAWCPARRSIEPEQSPGPHSAKPD